MRSCMKYSRSLLQTQAKEEHDSGPGLSGSIKTVFLARVEPLLESLGKLPVSGCKALEFWHQGPFIVRSHANSTHRSNVNGQWTIKRGCMFPSFVDYWLEFPMMLPPS